MDVDEKGKDRERNEQFGGMAGLGAGVIVGARIGSVLIPVPLVGTFVGGLLGGVVGSAVGQRVGAAALSGVNAFFDSLTAPAPQQGDAPGKQEASV